MIRMFAACALALSLLAGCAGGPSTNEQGVYRISERERGAIQGRMLDSVNQLRQAAGVPPVQLDAQLTAAAQTQAQDMSRQHRAWPFGTDGSNPYSRVSRSGFPGELVGELYSQSFENEMETLTAWIDNQAWGPEILSADATHVGVAWQQDANGVIWWVMTIGKMGGYGLPAT